MKIRVAIAAGVFWLSSVPNRVMAQGAVEATAPVDSPRLAMAGAGLVHTPRFGWREFRSWWSYLQAGDRADAGGDGRVASSSDGFERGDLLAVLLPAYRGGDPRSMLAALQATGDKGKSDPAVAYLQAMVAASLGDAYDPVAAGHCMRRFLLLTQPKAPAAGDRDDWAMLPFLRQFELEGAESVTTLRLQAESLQRQIGAKVDLPLVDFAEYAALRTRLQIVRADVRDAEKDVKKKRAAVEKAEQNLRQAEAEPPRRGGTFNDSERTAHISSAKNALETARDRLSAAEGLLEKTSKKAEVANARLRRYEAFRHERRPLAK